jgi:hypothetical protein
VVLVFALVMGYAYARAYQAYNSAKPIVPELRAAQADLLKGTVPPAGLLARASQSQARAQAAVGGLPARFAASVPFLGSPVRSVTLAVDAVGHGVRAASILRSIVAALLGSPRATGGSAVFRNGKVNLKLLSRADAGLARAVANLHAGQSDLQGIGSVPFGGRIGPLKSRALADFAHAIASAERVREGMRLLPAMLGARGPRTYFVALQTGSADRATGGAVYAYAIVHLTDGRIRLVHSGEIGPLRRAIARVSVPLPAELSWYVKAARLRPQIDDGVDYSPDFPAVAATWAQMIRKAWGLRVDGVVAIDPLGVSYALSGEPPLRVPGYAGPLPAAELPRVTESQQYHLPRAVQAGLATGLLTSVMGELTHPVNAAAMLKGMGSGLTAKHVQVWFAVPAAERLVADLAWAGSLQHTWGDYLYLADNQRAIDKVGYFTRQSLNYEVTIQPSGAITSALKVWITNHTPSGIGLLIPGTYPVYAPDAAMLSLYVPGRVRDASASPSAPLSAGVLGYPVYPAGFTRHSSQGFGVLTQTIAAWPGHPGILVLRYVIPGAVRVSGGRRVYQLAIQHQPLAHPALITITVHLPAGATPRSWPAGWLASGDVVRYRGLLTKDMVARITF